MPKFFSTHMTSYLFCVLPRYTSYISVNIFSILCSKEGHSWSTELWPINSRVTMTSYCRGQVGLVTGFEDNCIHQLCREWEHYSETVGQIIILTCLLHDILCHMCQPYHQQELLLCLSHHQPRPFCPLHLPSFFPYEWEQIPHSVCQQLK